MKRGRTEEEITLDNLPDLTAVSKPDAVIPLPPGVVAEETPVFNSQATPFVPKSRPKIIKRPAPVTTDESDPIAFIVSKRDRTKNYGERKIKRVHRDTTRELPPEPIIVPVKNNNKVDRCARCNTFVKKGVPHLLEDCNARIYAKKNRVFNPKGPKKFRMTEKRKAEIIKGASEAAAFRALIKPIKSVEKWAKKKEKHLSSSTKDRLDRMFAIVNNGAPAKKIASTLRKFGLSVQ